MHVVEILVRVIFVRQIFVSQYFTYKYFRFSKLNNNSEVYNKISREKISLSDLQAKIFLQRKMRITV